MGPKKKQVSNRLDTAPKKLKSKTGTTTTRKTSNKSSTSPVTDRTNKTTTKNDSGKDNDSDYYSGNLQSQPSQLFLGRKNRLNDLLASQTSHTDATKTGPKGKKTGNRSKDKFEEDDGFIYKRGQEKDTKKRQKPANSLISQLKEETNQISQDDDNLRHLDLEEQKTKKPRKQPKTSKPNGSQPKTTTRSNGLVSRQSAKRISPHDESYLQLSSPIKSPNYENFYNATSSDEYVEQVSHLKMSLADSDATRKRTQKMAPNAKNKRRASYYNRGKRVLSIGNGFVGVPHEDVPTSDYYKLLDTSLPEPHRMRQLLIWCFKKKLDQEEKLSRSNSKTETTEDQTVINIAKVIKEEVLRDLVEGQISISWYNRDDNEDETNDNMLNNKGIILPNPLNITNEENIEVFTKKLKSLKRERSQWETSFNRSTSHIPKLKIDANQSEADLQEYFQTRSTINDNSLDFNSTILNHSLVDKIINNYNKVSEHIPEDVETSTDRLYDTSYRLSQAHDLIARLQNDKLNEKVSSLVQNYMTKHLRGDESFGSSTWPVPNRKITTKELLRGITRFDDPDAGHNN